MHIAHYLLLLFLRKSRLKFPGIQIWRFVIFRIFIRRRFNQVKIESAQNLMNKPLDSSGEKDYEFSSTGRSVGVVMPRYTIRSNRLVESDLYFAYTRSANALDIAIYDLGIHTDYPQSKVSKSEDRRHLKPELLIIDGNEPPGFGQNSLDMLTTFKKSDSYLLVDIPDCYSVRNGKEKVMRWLEFADLVVIHNQRISVTSSMSRRLLVWPGFPIPEKLYFKTWETKSNFLNILGYQHRQRELFVEAAIHSGLPLSGSLHNNRKQKLVIDSYKNYISTLKDSKIHFTNGYISPKESIIVGRAIETLAASSTLLYENGSDLECYLEPYRDFVPIINVPDFVEKSRFLIENEEYAKSIAKSGEMRMKNTHGSPLFWKAVFERLGIV